MEYRGHNKYWKLTTTNNYTDVLSVETRANKYTIDWIDRGLGYYLYSSDILAFSFEFTAGAQAETDVSVDACIPLSPWYCH